MLYRFEDFTLDITRRELRRGEKLLAIEPKVFDLLVHLIANRDRVVGKDELIAAVWNGRIVSESALATCINAARVSLGDSGGAQRLIKTLPRKGVRFVGMATESAESHAVAAVANAEPTKAVHPALPEKPSVAILPFANMSADPEQQYFCDGVVEEITTALSQVPWLFVIARNSSFTFKGREVDAQEVARELGVRYVLTGSVRRAANRVRIGAQLIEASTRAQIWAGQLDGTLEDIFDLQDEVTRNVVGMIVPKLEAAEIERSKRSVTENLGAYDFYLRSLAALRQRSKEANSEALRFAKQAFGIDSSFATAYALAAFCYTQRRAHGWMTEQAEDTLQTASVARRAAELGSNDAVALCWSGQALAYVVHDIEMGAALIDRALLLNPNLADAWHWGGWVKIWLGDPEAGVQRISYGMRLSPLDPFMPLMQHALAHGYFFESKYGESASWAARALSQFPDLMGALRISSASNAFAGNAVTARKSVERLLAVHPGLRVSNLRNVLGPYQRADFVAKYEEGLRRAGLPE